MMRSPSQKFKKHKKNCRYTFILILSFFSILTLACLIPTKWFYQQSQNCNLNIYIVNVGVHADIIVPLQTQVFDWSQHLAVDDIGTDTSQKYKYLGFGWGEEDFYLNTPTIQDIELLRVLKAFFSLNNSSVLRVQGYQNLPSKDIKTVQISSDNYLKLTNFLLSSFQTAENKKPVKIANGYANNDGFYAANGSYSILRTCNQWTADVLRTADINTPLWAGTSSAIMWHLRSNC